MQAKHPQSLPLFSLGSVVATRAVFDHLTTSQLDAKLFLQRHQRGDWGDVPPEDTAENDFAVKNGLRIFSSYQMAGKRVWVITDARPQRHHFAVPLRVLASQRPACRFIAMR